MTRTHFDLNRAAVIGSLCLVSACAVEPAHHNPDGGSRDTGTWNAAQLALRAPIVAVPVVAPVPAKVRTPPRHVRTVLEAADPMLENLDVAASWLPPLAADVMTPVPAPEPAFPTCAVDGEAFLVDDIELGAEPEVDGDDLELAVDDGAQLPSPEGALADFLARAVGQVFVRHTEIELMETMAMVRALDAVASGKSKEELAREVRGDVGLFARPLDEDLTVGTDPRPRHFRAPANDSLIVPSDGCLVPQSE